MWIAIFIVVFFQFCLLVRQGRMEVELLWRIEQVEKDRGVGLRGVVRMPHRNEEGQPC